MIKVDEKKIKINIFTYLILAIMLIVLLNDYITFVFNPSYLIGIVISALTVSGLLLAFRKKIKIDISFKKEDIIFYILLCCLMIITIPYPDRAFDTFNYHLYLQENPFGDKIFSDFFAGKNLNSFSYAFPDRIFYLFRYFLGYRLGVIFNYLLIIGIFTNVKDMLKKLKVNCKDMTLTIISIIATFSLSVIEIVDSYYIDLVSLYLLLELFNLMIMGHKLENNKKTNIKLFSIIGLLYGLTFAVKISNAVMLILFFGLYILKNRNLFKQLNIKNILCTCITFILPFALYFTYNVIETGNPVFPFYNTIFKSEFFGLWDWLDTRFGPHTIIETLLWPLYILKYPGRLVDTAIAEPMWCYGYFISIGYVLYYGFRKIKKQEVDKTRLFYFISTILCYLIWAKLQLGYSRYGLVVLVLGGISTVVFLTDIIKSKKNILIGLLLVLMLFNYNYSVVKYLAQNNFWIFNNLYNNKDDYRYNVEKLFSKEEPVNKVFKDNSAWLIFYYNAGYARMINNKLPIITATSGVDNDYTREIYDKNLNKYDHFYTLVDALDFQNFIISLNDTQFKITDVVKVLSSNIIGTESSFTYIFEVEKCNKLCENKMFSSNLDYFEDIDDKYDSDIWVGVPKDLNHAYVDEFSLNINNNLINVKPDGSMINVDINDDLDIKAINNDYWYMIYQNKEER